MRGPRFPGPCLLAAALVLAAPICALDVPLTYTAVGAQGGAWYPSGNVYVASTVAAPAGTWKLPTLVSRHPLHVLARLGDETRLLIVDRKQADDAFYSRLYFDANGNRDLTDDPVHTGEVYRDTGSTYANVTFRPISTQITVGGRSLPFSLRPYVYTSRVDRLASAALTAKELEQMVWFNMTSSCYYSGKVRLDGKAYTVTLGDANCDGLFTSALTVPNWTYADGRLPLQGDTFVLSTGSAAPEDALTLGRYLAVGESLMEVAVDIPGGKLTLTPLEAGASLRLPVATSKIQLVSRDGGALMAYGSEKAVPAPPGAYRLASYQVQHNPILGDHWLLDAAGMSASGWVECRAGGAADLTFGPPYSPRVVAYEWDRRAFTSGSRKDMPLQFFLYGKGGEVVTDLRRTLGSGSQIPMSERINNRPREPTYMILKTTGETVTTGSFEYG